MENNQIGDAGAATLSEALKSNATLTTLEYVARALLCAGCPVSPRACLTLSSSLQPGAQPDRRSVDSGTTELPVEDDAVGSSVVHAHAT